MRWSAPAVRTLDRREMLLGLSTVPALGLFGYALHRQSAFEQQRREAALAQKAAAGDVAEVNVALLGAGAQGEVLLNSMLRIPVLRFRAVCDIWKEYNQKRAVNTLIVVHRQQLLDQWVERLAMFLDDWKKVPPAKLFSSQTAAPAGR